MRLPELETSDWYALLMPAYAAVLCAELAVARRRGERWFGFAETLSNLSAGMGTLLIGLLIGPLVLGAYSLAYRHLALVSWPQGSWLKWPCALLLSDLCYYLWHRSGHRFGLLWAIHGVHHQHERLNSTVGLRLEWLGDPVASCFFWPLPLLGIDPATGFSAIAVLSAYTLTAHMPLCARPTLGLFVTPAVHGGHHSRDARFQGRNFGAMLTVWDRLFGTYREPAPGEVLGAELPTICRMHDAVTAPWSLMGELWGQLR
jgi:sterol desaturase/sphingolipid hydroxylase (fatty acid hydroxylase superfamily)